MRLLLKSREGSPAGIVFRNAVKHDVSREARDSDGKWTRSPMSAQQKRDTEVALKSGQAEITQDGEHWGLKVKRGTSTRYSNVKANTENEKFHSREDAYLGVLQALGVKAGERVKAYEDVGAKIGGARKDIADRSRAFEKKPTARGFQEIEAMDPAAASRLCKKATLWPLPSIDEDEAKHENPAISYSVRALYSLIAPKPFKDEPAERERYMAGLMAFQAIVKRSGGDYNKFSDQMLEWKANAGICRDFLMQTRVYRNHKFEPAPKPTAQQAVQGLNAAALGQRFNDWMIGRKIPTSNGRELRFSWVCGEQSERWSAAHQLKYTYKYPAGSRLNAEMSERTPQEQWSKVRELLGVTPTDEEIAKTVKPKTPEELASMSLREKMLQWERSTPSTYERKGGKAVTARRPQDFLKNFGLRGVEFGNWMDNDSARQHVERCAEAFQDMADVLGIPASKLSLNGRLSLAFGARGVGGMHSGVAHYEPHKVVINLTKEGGAGSLAHEWGHFMDHVIHKIGSGQPNTINFASEVPLPTDPVHKHVDAIMNIINKGDGKIGYVCNPGRITDSTRFGSWDRASDEAKKDPQAWMNDFAARHPRNPVRQTREIADYIAKKTGVKELIIPGGGISEYKARVERAETGKKAYWSRPEEMLARSFEAYVIDKMVGKKRANSYLIRPDKHGDDAPLPKGEERKRIDAEFDKMFDAIRETNMLQKAMGQPQRIFFKSAREMVGRLFTPVLRPVEWKSDLRKSTTPLGHLLLRKSHDVSGEPRDTKGKWIVSPHPTMPHLPNITREDVEQLKARDVETLPAPGSAWDLKLHPDPLNHRAATWVDKTGKQQAAYLNSYRAAQKIEKFNELQHFSDVLPKIRAKVKADLLSKDKRTQQLAAVVRLMDLTAIRVGSERNAIDNETFGASSLRHRHITHGENGNMTLRFAGKDDKEFHRDIRDTALQPVLQRQGGMFNDKLFGNVTDTHVRDYLKEFGVIPHKYRTYAATRIVHRHLRQTEWTDDAKQRVKHLNAALEEAAAHLNNGREMVRKNYADPMILEMYHAGKLHDRS